MKAYDNPLKGDQVVHIDYLDEPGTVISVSEFAFEVEWPDGSIEDYNVQDHPDILSWEG